MKTAKRALSLLLSLMLVLGTVAVGGINAAADESLYEISSYADLKNFASLVNSGNTSACAKLMNDIECKNGDGTAAKDWTPIGNVSNNYIGTFDGDCHVITGLSNAEVTDVPSYAGLFGYVGSKTEGGVTTKGTVKNVGLKGGSITGNNYVGGVVGNNYGGTVTNCCYTGDVSGNNGVGGVVGNNYGGTVTNCCYTGNVSGNNGVGGVAGQNYNNSSLKNCYNTGDVSGNNTVGGVAGTNFDSSTISNCYNTGDVSGNDSVGGVVGQNLDSSTISNCYNTGSVTAIGQFADAGGVVGYNFYNSSVENCCYDSDRAPGIPAIGRESSATHTIVEGLTTAQMTGANALDNMTFAYEAGEESPWLTKADGADENGGYYWFYPHLKGFAYDRTSAAEDWPAKVEITVASSDGNSCTYDGEKHGVYVTVGDTSVPEGGDVTYSQYTYSDENNRWEWKDISVTPTGHGNYKMEISFGEDTVTKYFTILDPATDYTVSYYKKTGEDWSMNSFDPIDAGDYKAVVTFTDTGHDQIEKMFTINPKSLTGAIVTLSQVTAEYTGGGIMPEVTEVKVGEKVLNKNTDYIVSYGDNINASENAKVIVTGKGNYKDSVEKMFTISPAGVTLTANSRNTDIYDGTEKTVTGFTSSVSDLTFDGVTASGSGTNAGSYVVSFSGVTINETTDTTGNYVVTGTVDGILTINPADPEMNAAAQDVDYGQTAVVTFTAPADAKGKVTFTLDEAESGVTKDIENGQAVCEFENLTIGSHKVECVYTGDSNYYSATKETTFTVNSVDCALTINYFYSDGTQAAETYTDNVEIFKEYSVESPEITGYTPDIATVEGTMGDEDMNGKTVTVTYSPIEYTATFVDENGKTVKAVKFTVETEKLDEPDVPEKAGYAGEWEEYTLGMSDITIKPVYANITSIQIEDYEENSETGYKEDKTFTVKADDLPDGAEIHWFVNGEDVGTGESYTVEDPTDDYNIYAEIIDKDGNTLDTTKVQSVKVKNGFFDRLKAFFADLIEKILGKAIADFLSSVC